MVSQAKFLILLRETKADREVRLLNKQFRFQDMELSKQFPILAELRSRERVFQEPRITIFQEMQEFKNVRCSRAELLQVVCGDALATWMK